MKRIVLLLFATALPLAGGCFHKEPRVITSNDPSLKIPAIKQSVSHKDQAALRQLVRDLDSEDPAVRFYAIQGLARLTGRTYGYRYYDDETRRRPAVNRWNAWIDLPESERAKESVQHGGTEDTEGK